MTRRILRNIKIDKISAVDAPCQQGAIVAIMKRQPKEFADMTNEEISDLEKRVDQCLEEVNAALGKAKPANNSVDEYELDGNGGDAEDEEDDGLPIGKLAPGPEPRYPGDPINAGGGLHYPEDDLMEALQSNSETDRPGDLQTSDHGTWQAHAQRMVDHIAATENCSREEATRRLRQRYPEVASSHVPVAKSAPPMTFEDYVDLEVMRKGVTREIAGQRVAQAHGFTLPHRISKADVASADFADAAEAVWQDDTSLSRTEALRKARLENPRLYKRMQRG
jgi:hypothetical protein